MKKSANNFLLIICLGIAALLNLCLRFDSTTQISLNTTDSPIKYQLILDAGHGGEDGGAISLTGVAESNINLSIVLKIDQILGFYGVSPILLRDTDVSLHSAEADTLHEKKASDLKNRVALIQNTPNAFLISVHQNSFTNSAYHGAQVFYRDTAESIALAEYMQDALRQKLDPQNSRAPAKISDSIYLMKHVTCPALLVECGFLSNPTEENKLNNNDYQTQIAMCIAATWLTASEIQSGNHTMPVI